MLCGRRVCRKAWKLSEACSFVHLLGPEICDITVSLDSCICYKGVLKGINLFGGREG
jgi:hypothetical protein